MQLPGLLCLMYRQPLPALCPAAIPAAAGLAEGQCMVMFNPRLASGDVGVGLAIRRMRDQFLSRFTTTYSLRPIAEVGSVFRRYPGMWQVGGVGRGGGSSAGMELVGRAGGQYAAAAERGARRCMPGCLPTQPGACSVSLFSDLLFVLCSPPCLAACLFLCAGVCAGYRGTGAVQAGGGAPVPPRCAGAHSRMCMCLVGCGCLGREAGGLEKRNCPAAGLPAISTAHQFTLFRWPFLFNCRRRGSGLHSDGCLWRPGRRRGRRAAGRRRRLHQPAWPHRQQPAALHEVAVAVILSQ